MGLRNNSEDVRRAWLDDADDENDTYSVHNADNSSDGQEERGGIEIFLPLITK